MADLEKIVRARLEAWNSFKPEDPTGIQASLIRIAKQELEICLDIYEREKLVEKSDPPGETW